MTLLDDLLEKIKTFKLKKSDVDDFISKMEELDKSPEIERSQHMIVEDSINWLKVISFLLGQYESDKIKHIANEDWKKEKIEFAKLKSIMFDMEVATGDHKTVIGSVGGDYSLHVDNVTFYEVLCQALQHILYKLSHISFEEVKQSKEKTSMNNHQRSSEKEYDIFVCYVSEDKNTIVGPLVRCLEKEGIKVWYDEFEIKWGSGLRRTIEAGLKHSSFGLVILSSKFLNKESWGQKELDALYTTGNILPVWCGISADEIKKCMPLIADLKAKKIDKPEDIESIVNEVKKVLNNM